MHLIGKATRYGPPMLGRVFGLVAQTVVSWITLNFASSGDLGFYYVFVAWTIIFGCVLGFGLPENAMRVVAATQTVASKTYVRRLGLVLLACSLISGVATFFFLTGAASLPKLFPPLAVLSPNLAPSVLITSMGVFGLVGVRIGAQVIKALGLPTIGLYTEFVFPFIPLLAGALIIGPRNGLSGEFLAWMHVTGFILTVFISSAVMVSVSAQFRVNSSKAKDKPLSDAKRPGVFREIVNGLGFQWWAVAQQSFLLNIPLISVSLLVDEAAAGIFGLCLRIVAISMIGTDVIISICGPTFAKLHANCDHAGLNATFASSQKATLALSIPLCIAVWFLATPILQFFNITDTQSAKQVLLVLLIGRLISAFIGPVSYFLWMISAFKEEISATAFALAVLVGSILFVSWHSTGDQTWAITVATVVSLSSRFVLQFILVQRLGAKNN